MALVQTVDFITPIVDDPFLFGQIAAANALSDVYAMGGKPLTALNIVGFPRETLDLSILTEILRGGLEKVHEAGAVLLGGHTVNDLELKYGLSVTGRVDPGKIVTNRGARAGDALILTKALGTGIISTAQKAKMADAEIAGEALASMVQLNDKASEAMIAAGAHACTDITGFGLLGHGLEMAQASGCGLRLFYSRIPVLRGAKEYAASGLVPGGAYCNQDHFGLEIYFSPAVPEAERILLYDPQTSGGLLIAVPGDHSADLLNRLRENGVSRAALIGEVVERGKCTISVE
jgi:selenide, water dikinase